MFYTIRNFVLAIIFLAVFSFLFFSCMTVVTNTVYPTAIDSSGDYYSGNNVVCCIYPDHHYSSHTTIIRQRTTTTTINKTTTLPKSTTTKQRINNPPKTKPVSPPYTPNKRTPIRVKR